MTARTLLLTSLLAAGTTGSAVAQSAAVPREAPVARGNVPAEQTPRPRTATPEAAPPPPPAPTVGAPRRTGQPINIRIDVTVTDQRGGAAPVKKTMSVVTADAMGGRIRSSVSYGGVLGDVPLNIDTEPTILADGKVRVIVNLQYDLPGGVTDPQPGRAQQKTQIQENLALVLENGKALVAAQSADPVGDRQVTVEVKATILR